MNIMKLRRYGARIVLAFAAVFVLPVIGFTGTASAYACPANTLCAWYGTNGTGVGNSWGGDWHNTCWSLVGTSFDDVISSVDNNLPVDVDFYRYDHCSASASGDLFTVKSGNQATYGDGSLPWLMNNAASSIKFH